MVSLSQTSAYAVHALSCVRHAVTGSCLTAEIAEVTGIPKPYLAKIVNKLDHAGLIRAKRGHQGGIVLARPADQISLLEIVEAVEGRNWIAACPLGMDGCTSQAQCLTFQAWSKLSGELRQFLRTTTLADTLPFSRHPNTRKVTRRAACAKLQDHPANSLCGSGFLPAGLNAPMAP